MCTYFLFTVRRKETAVSISCCEFWVLLLSVSFLHLLGEETIFLLSSVTSLMGRGLTGFLSRVLHPLSWFLICFAALLAPFSGVQALSVAQASLEAPAVCLLWSPENWHCQHEQPYLVSVKALPPPMAVYLCHPAHHGHWQEAGFSSLQVKEKLGCL